MIFLPPNPQKNQCKMTDSTLKMHHLYTPLLSINPTKKHLIKTPPNRKSDTSKHAFPRKSIHLYTQTLCFSRVKSITFVHKHIRFAHRFNLKNKAKQPLFLTFPPSKSLERPLYSIIMLTTRRLEHTLLFRHTPSIASPFEINKLQKAFCKGK